MSGRDSECIQRATCVQFGADYVQTAAGDKLGIANNVKSGLLPINGLRHVPSAGTSGWYIWAGEGLSRDPEFFQPLHAVHIHEWCPQVEAFLGLAPGWRFLLAGDYQDVWFDPDLLRDT